jgi:hypothetical protein
MFNKRKWLTRLNQKVMEMGRAALHSALVIHKSPGREQASNPMNSNRRNVETPYRSLSGTTGRKLCFLAVWVWDVGRSECRIVMVRIRVGTSPGTKVSPRPTGLTSQESMWNRDRGGKQMTTAAKPMFGASPPEVHWDAIDWQTIERHVQRLQMRIAKATREVELPGPYSGPL